MDLSQYADLFLAESREHLSACNTLLLALERNPAAKDPVSGIFRAMHTVKGMAATMGYARVAELAHAAETLLDGLREGSAPVSDETVQLLFRALDGLERSVQLAVSGRDAEAETSGLKAELERAGGKRDVARSTTQTARTAADVAAPVVTPGRLVRVVLRDHAPLKGGRALIVLRHAQQLGEVGAVSPPVETFESEDFDGHFAFRLSSAAPTERIVEVLSRAGDVESVDVREHEPVLQEPEAAGASEGGKTRHLRVDLRRLDALMDLIGELVIARGRLNELSMTRRDPAIDDIAISITRLSRDLQDQIIQARMTPVWQVFDRFPRLVRDSARLLGKQVLLRVEGKEIELDRTILDELGDPLVHLLRNAIDHGIEPPDERRRLGKKPEGEIVLSAVRERSSVMITIADDGRGIARDRVLERAKREGLVDAHTEALTDDQLLRIIARPGFSTAASVSNVSGRGVGIDVAMTKLRALGGSIDVRSEPGRGTSFVLRLPVTLAIVRALIAAVGRERYALPLTYVSETVEFGVAPATTIEGRDAIVLRDRVVPLVHLRDLLAISENDAPPPPPRRPIVVVEMGDRRAGIVVDGMLGQQEIVVKGFDAPQGTLPLFSGATIMGDGVPALILDAGGLL